MNAEVREKIDFKRVNELIIGEKFMWQGIWFIVRVIDSSGVYSDNLSRTTYSKSKKNLVRLGAKSQMFVQVAK